MTAIAVIDCKQVVPLAAVVAACSLSRAVELDDESGRGLFAARVEFPVGTAFRKGRLFPVEVELGGPVRPRRGSLLIEDGETAFFPPQGNELAAGRRYSCLLLLNGAEDRPAVVVRGPEGGELFRAGMGDALFPLAGKERLVLAVGEDVRLPAGAVGTVELRRQPVRPERLPRDAAHLECADIIALDEGGLERLSRTQMEAVRLWAYGGGRVIACSPRAAQTLARVLLADELDRKSPAIVREVMAKDALAALVFECGLGRCLAYLQPPEAARTPEMEEALAQFVGPLDAADWMRAAEAGRPLGAREVRRARWLWLASLAAVSFLLLPVFLRKRAVLIGTAAGCAILWTAVAYALLPPGAPRGVRFSFARASADGRALVSTGFLLARVRGKLDASAAGPLVPVGRSGEFRLELFEGDTWRLRAEGEGEILLAAGGTLTREPGDEAARAGWRSRARELALDLDWRTRPGDGPRGELERALGAPGMPFAWLSGAGRIECRGELNDLGLLLRVEAEGR